MKIDNGQKSFDFDKFEINDSQNEKKRRKTLTSRQLGIQMNWENDMFGRRCPQFQSVQLHKVSRSFFAWVEKTIFVDRFHFTLAKCSNETRLLQLYTSWMLMCIYFSNIVFHTFHRLCEHNAETIVRKAITKNTVFQNRFEPQFQWLPNCTCIYETRFTLPTIFMKTKT